MITNWLKKKIMKSLVEEAVAKLPELKNAALKYWEEHKEEIIEQVKEKIIEIIKSNIL